jgi:CIC family chloride channel protein
MKEGRTRALIRRESAWSAEVGRGHLFMVAIAIVCGLGGGFGAVALRSLIEFVQGLFFGHGEDVLQLVNQTPWTWRMLAPALGGLVVGPLVYFFAKEAKGHGVPEVMESIIVRGGVIRPRVVVVKALASAITIGSGGSVGREGPIVQIGSALGSTIGQLLGISTRQIRTLVGCGAAAGIAAAFNAPIAGALFAVEILLGDFGVPQFSPIVIASVVATVVSRYFLGNFPAFEVPTYQLVSPFELIPYTVVGIIAGLVALTFTSILYSCEALFDRIQFPEYLKASIGGLLVGGIGVWFPQVFGVGYSTINGALAGNVPVLLLGILLIAKMVATSITLASGGSGGVFAPSLFLGAVTGGFLGSLIHQWFPTFTATSGAYALVTMGAVVGAATHAPITAIIMIFELTGDYHIIPPLMAACVVSTLVAMLLRRDSIYTRKLRQRGVDPFKEEDLNVLKNLYVRDIIDRDPEVIPASTSFAQILSLVVQSRHSEFFVIDEQGELLGAVSLSEFRKLIFEQDVLQLVVVAGDLVTPLRRTVRETDNLDLAMQLFSHTEVEELAVVDPQNPRKLVGVIHLNDVINARNQEVLRRDLAGSMSTTVSLVGKVRQVDIGDGYVVQEIPTPRSLVGHSLREFDFRARYGVQVIFIRTRAGNNQNAHLRVPTADDPVGEADTLIIAGQKAMVDRLEA